MVDNDADQVALRRLHDVALHAIAAQDIHVRDQLHAALREGRTSFRFERRDALSVDTDADGGDADDLFVVVVVDGHDVCAVDLRTITDPGD